MSEAVMQRLKISREGVILIKSFEGFRPRAIRRDDGQWVIGYGHTLSAREGATVSEADAELLLQYDLIPVARAVNEGVAAALNQHQFDALASFAFSVGVDRFQSSDVLSRLNAGFAGEAADAMIGWPEPVLPETALRRRAAERALFVANPAWPVALADLLAAPLPPPVVTSPEPAPAPEVAAEVAARIGAETGAAGDQPSEPEVPSEYVAPDLDSARRARHAAVAALLADPAPVLRQDEPVPPSVEDVVAPIDAPAPEAPPEASETDVLVAPVAPVPEVAPVEPVAPKSPALEAPEITAAEVVSGAAAEPTVPAPAPAKRPSPSPFAFSGGMPMQRYSAYSGAIVGPLPGPIQTPMNVFAPRRPVEQVAPATEPMAEATPDVTPEALHESAPAAEPLAQVEARSDTPADVPAETPADVPAEAPAEAAPDKVDSVETVSTPEAQPEPWYVSPDSAVESGPAENATAVVPGVPGQAASEPAFAETDVAEPEAPEPVPSERPVEPLIVAPAAVDANPFTANPFVANPFALAPEPTPEPGPVAWQPSPFDAAAPLPALELPVFTASVAPASVPASNPWPAITATSEPRTDGALVLNPSPETEVFAAPRLVWPQGEQQEDAPALFEDDGSLRLAPGNILRHEAFEETVPAPVPWGELAAYGVMGGFGLVSFGMSMAAFRRASEEGSGGDGTILIAIVLAVIGAACVGVSAYNLYRRWGRTDEE